ncbi:MAG: formyl transferase [Cryomorphaceae bacterium]|nr:MAG: formyl transferase [Cryomorphaceae bacterium]
MSKRVVLLATDGMGTRMIFHALQALADDIHMVLEQPQSRAELVKKRIKKLGIIKVIGQLKFQLGVMPLLEATGASRVQEILNEYDLSTAPVPPEKIIAVPSANSSQCVELVQSLRPDLVVLCGTRILRKETLQQISATVVNIHTGITPEYRGVHGGYWALAQGDAARFGTTLHLVDSGIDTGGVIEQRCVEPAPKDQFATYPVLQMAVGVQMLVQQFEALCRGNMQGHAHSERGRLWYHPTIWEYFGNRIVKGVR